MATPAENAATEWANWQAKLTEASFNPRLNYTLPNGASVDFKGYYEFLAAMRDKAYEAMIKAAGPFEVVSRAV